jgi:hypothetical protein
MINMNEIEQSVFLMDLNFINKVKTK